MDDDIREWGGYYEQPRHIHLEQSRLLGLQLRPSAVDRDVKPFLTHHQHQHRGDPPIMVNNGGYHHRGYEVSEPQPSMDFINDGWMNHRENKLLHGLPRNPNFSHFSETSNSHQQFHMPPQPPPQSHDAPNDDRFFQMEEPVIKKDAPLKKRLTPKSPKVKKPKKPKDETLTSIQRSKPPKHQNAGVIIHGIDLSGIPTPVCSCTGVAQQCYRWGCGGWQSACCTTSISMYPLPMSTKRRGARIAGRKMSQGAFKKVLEKLMGEGYNLSNPIDLRSHWAKHGTNKFVTIR